MAAHAKLSPSSAERWTNCPGSVRLSAGLENRATVAAAEGSAAHHLAETCLRDGVSADQFADWHASKESITPEPHPGSFPVTTEMVDAVQVYLDICTSGGSHGDATGVEARIELSDDVWGTADFYRYSPTRKHLRVIDFKYGANIRVSPDENLQAIIYALGVLKRIGNRGVKTVEIVIVQPRIPGEVKASAWTINALDLLDYTSRFDAAVADTKQPNAPLRAGDWCRFCPAGAVCPALLEQTIVAAGIEFDEAGLPETENLPEPQGLLDLPTLLPKVRALRLWAESVEAYALAEAKSGRPPAGLKLVTSRFVRTITDEPGLLTALVLEGVETDGFYTPPKLLSAAKIEGKLKTEFGFRPKAAKELLAGFIARKPQGVTLAPLDDPREAVSASADDEFNIENES